LYDAPAGPFVMSFLGPVTRLAGQLVRPHDIMLHTTAATDAVPGRVVRTTRVGFEVRFDVLVDDAPVQVVMTRAEARTAGATDGATVWLQVAPGVVTMPAAGVAEKTGVELQPALA